VIGQLEASRLAIVRAGERALFESEDFRFEQRIGQCRAVDGLELLRAAAAQLVNHAGDDFLARSGRSEDEHRDVRLGGGADPLEHDEHLLVASDHFAEALHRRRLIFRADRGAPLEERVEQDCRVLVHRSRGAEARRHARHAARDAEGGELVETILDVQPQAAEGRHQRFDVEGFLGSRAQEAEKPRPERRLYKVAEPRLEIRPLGGFRKRRNSAPGGKCQFVHSL